jgi:hypothetical protein
MEEVTALLRLSSNPQVSGLDGDPASASTQVKGMLPDGRPMAGSATGRVITFIAVLRGAPFRVC